jgi:hypothetical protein
MIYSLLSLGLVGAATGYEMGKNRSVTDSGLRGNVDMTFKPATILTYNRLKGVDYSSLVSVDSHTCLFQNGYDFVVPRGYRSSGTLDDNVCQNLVNAQKAGFATREVSATNRRLFHINSSIKGVYFPLPHMFRICGDSNEHFGQLLKG